MHEKINAAEQVKMFKCSFKFSRLKDLNYKWTRIIILLVIILLGFTLRICNLDFPSIGYHNGKENQHLGIAQEMINHQDFTTRRLYFFNAFSDNPDMQVYPELPLVAYQIILAWNIFGHNLWGPRLLHILFFGISSILVFYFICNILFKDKRLALFGSFLLAVMPLGVFFSRNLQPESPAFFFMLLGSLFYFKFASSLKKIDLFLGGMAFSIVWAYKMGFILAGVLPFLFCLPFKEIFKNKKRLLEYAIVFISSYLLILVVFFWYVHLGQWHFDSEETVNRIRFFRVFSLSYWKQYGRMIWWYVYGENYGLLFSFLAVIGIASAFIKRKGRLDYYLIGGTVSIVIYSMIFSDHINQHNYYQMPFLGLVCLSCAYSVLSLSQIANKVFKKDTLAIFIFLVVILSGWIVWLPIKRMYSTLHFGADISGETLRGLTRQEEKVFLLTHPHGWAIATYAQRRTGWPIDLNDFKEKESRFKVRYICVYPPQFLESLEKKDPPLFSYIQGNYHLKEFGFVGSGQIMYYILEKGKGEILNDTLKSLKIQPQVRNIYKVFGNYIVFYSVTLDTEVKVEPALNTSVK